MFNKEAQQLQMIMSQILFAKSDVCFNSLCECVKVKELFCFVLFNLSGNYFFI